MDDVATVAVLDVSPAIVVVDDVATVAVAAPTNVVDFVVNVSRS